MLPLFEFAGDLVTDPVTFEDELKANESLSLENMRALSRCAHTHTRTLHPPHRVQFGHLSKKKIKKSPAASSNSFFFFFFSL